MIVRYSCLGASLLASVLAGSGLSAENDVVRLAAAIRQVGPEGEGHEAARAAWKELATVGAEQLPAVLAGMDGAGPLAENWIRAAVETIAGRALDEGGKLPVAALEGFLADREHSPRARRLAYELIARVDATAGERLIPGMLDDPSLELRRDAVAMEIARADARVDTGRAAAIEGYRRAMAHARDIDQINAVVEKLKKLEQPVHIAEVFGFAMDWHLVGPFDNTGTKGFDVAYEPENRFDLTAAHQGKEGTVRWVRHTTSDPYGIVDLNKAIGKHMGAIAYAAKVVESDEARDVELRLGCINANKVWLNGELLTSNHVYHTAMLIDQFVCLARLRRGSNVILVKVAQNEQTEDWAQDWKFQLRVCDRFGTPISHTR